MEIQSKLIHSQGPCNISLSVSSNDLFTVGGDSRVVRHTFQKATVDSKDIASLSFEPVYSCSSKERKRCYIACTDNIIRACELDSFEFVEVVMKTTQPIQCIAVSHDSNYLAVATQDSKIDIISLDTRETTYSFIGHQGGVYYLAFDPSDQYVASMGADGTLRIWNVKQSKCITSKPYLDKEFVPRLNLSWCSTGNLIVPSGTKIDVIQNDNWISLDSFSSKFNHRVDKVAFSPNGLYIAYLTENEDLYYLCVVDIQARKEIFEKDVSYDEFNEICWSDDGRHILLLDKEVRLTQYEVLPDHVLSGVSAVTQQQQPVSSITKQQSASVPKQQQPAVATIQVDDESDDEIIVNRHLHRLKQQQQQQQHEEEEEEDQVEEETNLPEEEEEGIPTEEAYTYHPEETSIKFQYHGMFMPGQSEVVQDRCFLAYNEIGLIVKRGEGTESVIEIEFTDSSRKRVILRDGSDIVVGSLSSEGVILGGVTTEEDGSNKGILLYRPFHSWNTRSSWRIELPGTELPDLVACTDSMVFVYTSKGYLRSWHVSGVQRSIHTPCNHMVSMVGRGNTLAIVYEDSLPYHHDYFLHFILYSTKPFHRLYQGPLPLSPHASLTWIGFTREGFFASYDSQMILRAFMATEVPLESIQIEDMDWIVLMNIKRIMKEKCAAGEAIPYCWIVALSLQSIKYVFLPSAVTPVLTLPRPVISVMDIDLPLCNSSNPSYTNEKSTLLTTYKVAARSLQPDWEEEQLSLTLEFDKMILRQVNVELANNQFTKAEYLCSLIHSVTALEKASYLAQKVENSTLVNHIEEMIEKKMNMESIDDTPSQPSQIEDSLENRLSQSSLKRNHENVHENTKRVEVEETTTQRPVNVFKRTQYESPVKKSLLGQIHSVVSPLKKKE